jgi:hypothetical protein
MDVTHLLFFWDSSDLRDCSRLIFPISSTYFVFNAALPCCTKGKLPLTAHVAPVTLQISLYLHHQIGHRDI